MKQTYTEEVVWNALAFQEALEGKDIESTRSLIAAAGPLAYDPTVNVHLLITAISILQAGIGIDKEELRIEGRNVLRSALGLKRVKEAL